VIPGILPIEQRGNTLLPFHNIEQINPHQKRMLTVTMPAMNNDIIDRHIIFAPNELALGS